jgi:hypothetical protein
MKVRFVRVGRENPSQQSSRPCGEIAGPLTRAARVSEVRLSSRLLVLVSVCVLNACGGGSGDPFDGEYECSFDGGPPVSLQMHIVGSRVPEPFDAFASMQALWEGSIDPTTGTFSGDYHQNPPLLEVTYEMKGQFATDATPGGAAGSGTYWKSEPPGYPQTGPGTWKCARLPIVASAPLTILPTAPTLTVGEVVNLLIKDAADNAIAVTWQSSSAAVTTVSPADPANRSVPLAAGATSASGLLTAVATGTATVQVQDPISLATASTTVTVVDSVDVSPWVNLWKGTIIEPTILASGAFDCGTPVTSSATAAVDAIFATPAGNLIAVGVHNARDGTTAFAERFLVPATGETAVSADDTGDTLTLSGSTLTWTYAGTGCTSFSGTQ